MLVHFLDGLLDTICDSFAARAAGVTRHMRVAEAIKICPELQLVHVQTIGKGPLSARRRKQPVARCRWTTLVSITCICYAFYCV